ncbi:UDP-N-acetylmuramoyl-L-alanyl-D-glutamate--2,6-diaminopimelate ligase [Dethiosulfovibrio sp. F2B]|uniref:UDP-N-acetylmuramoyl-L-alanyl-D-glutamate--2, 6-diaminopimelate ligase n=1 Tax=Dethiosulfovibrio faecalis TaxID=2720018 RepID=UPI001F245EEA|nr:UDP-N-acetylmuramoyl-L-alanyl-D-glutamate--2,6-diaminopimelate ligase [Dethiosulfovibrio faecalis]MCF4150533.1 UDP-N-acetylmuramoyl-L-alanyl-D-glutamate--2,6-diaminopimelate ligase [Dethiosulfovibrio faecalis]
MIKRLRGLVEDLRASGMVSATVGQLHDEIVRSIEFDSRRVTSGTLFCCVPGVHNDGHNFAVAAVKSGATALLCEHIPDGVEKDVPIILTADSRSALGAIASSFHDHPSRSLSMVGVTGTNGKSTTTYMIRSIMRGRGKVGLLGTITYDDGNKEIEADRTTPEGSEIQAFLSEMVRSCCHGCVMETSSHGLAQGRLSGCLFDVAVFTNLTSEHLDFHGDMERYFEAKKLLFTRYMKPDCKKIFNMDDPYGKRLLGECTGSNVVTYSSKSSSATVTGSDIALDVGGLLFDLAIEERVNRVRLPLIGRYNVSNALAAAAACHSMGFSYDEIQHGLENIPQVPGRMERYLFDKRACAIVDYAHTPDALSNLLSAARDICNGRLIGVFGLGGERFRGNRWAMGEIAAQKADHLVLTMDNPRGEDPLLIVKDILEGVHKVEGNSYDVVIDRKDAIYKALDMSREGDVVVISGKGPENYILIKGKKTPYSDSESVRSWGEDRGVSWK